MKFSPSHLPFGLLNTSFFVLAVNSIKIDQIPPFIFIGQTIAVNWVREGEEDWDKGDLSLVLVPDTNPLPGPPCVQSLMKDDDHINHEPETTIITAPNVTG